jgi:hypothetical protein
MFSDPLLPDFDDPLPRYRDPLIPELAVPVLNMRSPLTPDAPAFDVDIIIRPLDDDDE